MKILLFHPRLLPPVDYGGVERVVLWLAKGLLERGHEVFVAAWRGSILPTGVHLIEAGPEALSDEELLSRFPKKLDVVHYMAPPGESMWDRSPATPLLTVHGNGKPGEKFPKNTVFLSANHAARHGREAFVHNGIDPGELLYRPESKTDSYLFFSKTSWSVKNLRGAMRLCRRAHVPLEIAGGSRPWSLRLLAALTPGQRWVGPVAGKKKAELLSAAKALVFPVRWDEPFGLVVVEALMSGTPVLATRRGSLPELIPPEGGALLDLHCEADEEAWIQSLRNSPAQWNPEACREWAIKNFHYSRMAEGYESVYQKIIQGKSLHDRTLHTQGNGPSLG